MRFAPHLGVAERFLGTVLEQILEEQLIPSRQQHAVLVVLDGGGIFQRHRLIENANQIVMFGHKLNFLSCAQSAFPQRLVKS